MRAGTNLSTAHRGLLMVGAAAVLWGTSGLTATVAYSRGIHPLTVSSWRMALGAIALLPLLRSAPTVAARPTWADARRLAVIGVGLAAYQACYFIAVQRAGVSIATLITLGSAPVLVICGERLLTGRRIAPASAAGIVMAIAGLVALVGLPAGGGDDVSVGAAFAALSALGYAAVTLAGGTLSTRMGAQRLTVFAFLVAAVLLLPVTVATVGIGLAGDPLVLAAMLYLGIVPTALAYRLFFTGLQRITASAAALLVLLEPLVATGLAVPLAGDRLTPVGWVGAAVLLLAVVVSTRTPAQVRPAPSSPTRS
ncbi:DMT family transporter [Nitriliruptor alkaliphilus]|uniref:DMT family transporter n=1 Tax=Nitriliruptor alkaliphilus TaxID=427918 RepID=UPI0006987216|nr:EamA family transporter [Nitriliruptor alkaliphilus]